MPLLKEVVESSLSPSANRWIVGAAHRMCCSICGLPDSCECADIPPNNIVAIGGVIAEAQRCARKHLN